MNEREHRFYETFRAQTGMDLIYEPCRFMVKANGPMLGYMPDFLCEETSTFFEVVGSRQAYHQNKCKYKALKEKYPDIKFEIVTPDGSAYQTDCYASPAKEQLNIRVQPDDILAWKQQARLERRSLTSLIEAAMAQYLRYQASLIRLIESGIKRRKDAK